MWTDSLLVWLLTNWHWLIILGMLLSISGTLYISAGFLDQEHRFLGGLSQGFSFGLISGIFVGLGFGLGELLLFIPDIISVLGHPNFLFTYFTENQLPLVLIRFLLGLLSGLIFGFFLGFTLFGLVNVYNQRSTKRGVVLVYFVAFLIFAISGGIEMLSTSLVLPLADDPTTAATLIFETAIIFSFTTLLFIRLFEPIRRSANKRPKRISWRNFVLWHILANTLVFSLSLYVAWISGPENSTSIGEVLLLVGLFITILLSETHIFITQVKARVRAIRDKESPDIRFSHYEPMINWRRFVRGFSVGLLDGLFLCGGMFRIAALFGGVSDVNSTSLGQGIIGGLMVGLLFGSIYGFGPILTYKIEHLSERSLGQIGLALAVLGTLIALLPSLTS